MESLDHLIEKLIKVKHGFLLFEQEARSIVSSNSAPESLDIASRLIESDSYQVRSTAVFIYGFIAHQYQPAIKILYDLACSDISWQVQEMIAKAFDQFCKDNGYEKSLPEIKRWVFDNHPNVCRAVTEGLRIWTGRPFFKDHPLVAIELRSFNKSNDSEYLRKPVGNSLRDIAKKFPELVERETSTWDLTDNKIKLTFKHTLIKKNIG